MKRDSKEFKEDKHLDSFINLFEKLGEEEKNQLLEKVKKYFDDPSAIREKKKFSDVLGMFKNELDYWVKNEEGKDHSYAEVEVPFSPQMVNLYLFN